MVCGDCAVKTITSSLEPTGNSKEVDAKVVDVKVQDKPATSSSIVYEDPGHSDGAENIPKKMQIDTNGRAGCVTVEPILHHQLPKDSSGRLLFLTTLAWSLLIGSSAQIGLGIWISLKVVKMPRTFAWKSLMLPLGSMYVGSSESASLPIIPIVHTVITVFLVIFTLSNLVTWKKIYLKATKVVVWLHCIFHIPVIPISSALWSYKKTHLRQMMMRAMSPESEFSKFWNITQVSGECCGVDGPGDWEDDNSLSDSCCLPNTFDFYPGCYEVESITLETTGILLIASLVSGLLLAAAELYALISRNELRLRQKHQPPRPTAQTFLFRRESSLMSLEVTGSGTTFQMDGVLLEANGALSSNISVLENQATLHISDFRSILDNVEIEPEIGRITVSVLRNGDIRGRCAVTPATNEVQLHDLKVEDTKGGAVKVQFPPSSI